jgi:anti-anti-sigma factor
VYEVRVERGEPGAVVVRVAGEVDMAVEPILEQALRDAVADQDARRVIVDLEDLRFLDSSGIHALVKGYRAAAAAGQSFRLRNAKGAVARVLRVTGVADVLGLEADDEDERARGA